MHNAAVQPHMLEDGPQPVRFTATGSEYFRIWIVNVLLSIVTLGVYSAWAKVRRNQYFYAHTHLAGSSFEYHGNPLAILKGRIAAVLVLVVYQVVGSISFGMLLLMVAMMAALLPLMLWKSLQFKLRNTSYRGIRFGFDGSAGEAYAHFLLLPLLFGTWILAPLAHHRMKRWQHTESRFGAAHFRFGARVRGFYAAYGVLLLLGILVLFGLGGLAFALRLEQDEMATMGLLFYLTMTIIGPLFFTMIQNLIWNHTGLREHEFRCDMRWGGLLWIYASNLLAIIATLGLFIPFARVRALRFRLQAMSMLVNGSLDDFVAGEQEQVGATGEGLADFMDFDLSL